jgi:hypothetical protein
MRLVERSARISSIDCNCCDLPDPLGAGMIRAQDAHRAHLATLASEFAQLTSMDEIVATVAS